MRDAAPDVSVSVVTYASASCLPELLAALRAQSGVAFETFVVDNASTDATPRLLVAACDDVDLDVTLNSDNVGFGRAHNQNLERFRGRHVLLLNPDVRFAPDLAARLGAHLDAHPEVAIVGPRVLEGAARDEFAPRRCYPGEGMVRLRVADRDRDAIAWLSGCCLMIRRAVLQELGGFDPDYFLYGEEIDLCLRACRAGHRVGWCPDVAVHHLRQQSQGASSADERARRLFEGIATFWDKHYAPAEVRRMLRFQIAACAVLLAAGAALPALARRWPALAPDRLRARRAVCGERLRAAGERGSLLAELPLGIALRQLELAARWLAHRRPPLDDY